MATRRVAEAPARRPLRALSNLLSSRWTIDVRPERLVRPWWPEIISTGDASARGNTGQRLHKRVPNGAMTRGQGVFNQDDDRTRSI